MYNHDWKLYIAVFACAFALSLFITPYTKTIALKIGAIDYPKKRGMHNEPIPRLGGLAIVFGVLCSLFVAVPFVEELKSFEFIGFLIGAIIIVILGIVDDVKQLGAGVKLFFQIIAAVIVIASGTTIDTVTWPFSANISFLKAPITLVWIIGVTNAVNLIDGLDGLAAGVSSIAALCLMVLCIMTGHPLAVILTAALAGGCLGFLPRNFSPAEVIMGDTGATFLGYVLAVTSIMGVYKTYALMAIIISCLALGLPIFDTLFAMIRRAVQGKPIMQADRGHIHHRLIDAGFSHQKACITIYGMSFAMAIFAIVLASKDTLALTIASLVLVIFALMFFVYKKRTSNKKL